MCTFDPGFTSTASCESAITYIDGNKGVLLYRGWVGGGAGWLGGRVLCGAAAVLAAKNFSCAWLSKGVLCSSAGSSRLGCPPLPWPLAFVGLR